MLVPDSRLACAYEPFRNTLQKLSLTKNSNLTKDALLRAFKPVNSNTTWPSLTSLDVSDLPSVDDEVTVSSIT